MRTRNNKIKSLEALRKNKRALKKEMLVCEDFFLDDFIVLSNPMEAIVNAIDSNEYCEDNFCSKFFRLVKNIKRLVDAARLLSSIYSDYKRK